MLDAFVGTMQETMGIAYYILVYGIGALAMLLSVISYQFRRRVTILLSNFLGQSCWVAYFLLQADGMSALVCALSALMLALFAKKDKWPWATGKISVSVFLLLFSAFSLFTFRIWSDIFPLLAGIFGVIASSRATEKRLRQFSLPWCLFWLLNSAFKGYPVALANDCLCTASTAISLYRYREKKQ